MQDRSQFAADVFVGIDVAKGKHFVCALTTGGERLFSRPVPNDEGAIRWVINDASAHGRPALVVDTTSAAAAAVLALTVAAECQIPVAYVSGLDAWCASSTDEMAHTFGAAVRRQSPRPRCDSETVKADSQRTR